MPELMNSRSCASSSSHSALERRSDWASLLKCVTTKSDSHSVEWELRRAVEGKLAVSAKLLETLTMRIDRITLNPAVMGGKPCIRGLRVTVSMILGLLAAGKSRERILEAYPYLESGDIDAALAYAAWRLEEREEPLVGA